MALSRNISDVVREILGNDDDDQPEFEVTLVIIETYHVTAETAEEAAGKALTQDGDLCPSERDLTVTVKEVT